MHCAPHQGLGNYLRSLPAALIYSALTQQALTLQCDSERILNSQETATLHRHFSRFFRGPQFDWYFEAKLPPNARTVDLTATQSTPAAWAWNATGGSRVTSTLATHARRMLLFSRGYPTFQRWFADPRRPNVPGEAIAGDVLGHEYNLDGCLLRHMLAPTAALTRALHHATSLTVSGDALMPTAAMHVRAGDAVFAREATVKNASRRTWYAASEVRLSPFDAAPQAGLKCLARLSAASFAKRHSTGTQPLQAYDRASEVQLTCLRCIVLSDSAAVERCAKRVYQERGPILTPGMATHLAASSQEAVSDPTNQQKIFLDWMLLAMSSATLVMQPQSTFASTAMSFKVCMPAHRDPALHTGHVSRVLFCCHVCDCHEAGRGRHEMSPGQCVHRGMAACFAH